MSGNTDDVDFIALVTKELARDASLPDAVKAAILARAATLRVRRRRDSLSVSAHRTGGRNA